MEQDKPFKTIEVIDSRTGKQCKIACMSCIRGHRTTSCGIPVCRNKVFWTVKRPGRPSNSCTCKYGPGGRCECAVAKSACPHKPKKGEKRTIECRCDENGRYCCFLEVAHWDELLALRRPTVELFPSREDLDARREGSSNGSLPPTPADSASTPQMMSSTPSTPAPPLNTMQNIRPAPQGFTETPLSQYSNTPPSVPTTRLGIMGVGSPLGSDGHVGQDVLIWEGQSPPAPRDYQPYVDFNTYGTNDVMTPVSPAALQQVPYQASYSYVTEQFTNTDFTPMMQSMQDMTLPADQTSFPSHTVFDSDRWLLDYHNYQFPSAICQSCGLNGCSCRNCPAVMQNFESGSWAQGCAKKHVHLGPVPLEQPTGGCCSRNVAAVPQPDTIINNGHDTTGQNQVDFDMLHTQTYMVDPTLSQGFNIGDLKMMDGSGTIDLSEFLMNDINGLEQPTNGCCGGGR